ncbi:MAG: hypothetical protein H6739_07060 [Alphaproteobacteria bacterium]|nr:hypothetical protein [Alphaproteobacteria bacterium]
MLFGLLGLALSDCAGGGEPPPRPDTAIFFDTAVDPPDDIYDGPVEIRSVSPTCDDERWAIDVFLVGWMSETELFMADTSADWVEYGHPFPPTEPWDEVSADTRGMYDPWGSWDNPFLTLDIVADVNDVRLGRSTLFTCTPDQMEALTFSVKVWDTRGEEADCVAWGMDQDGTVDGYAFGDCRVL